MGKRARPWDVVVVGAGAAGIGIAHVLQAIGVPRFVVLERRAIGESFRRWPKEMRFITPSFPSNAFGLPDLNAVTMDTSPGYTLDTEHPSGEEYADYLEAIAEEYHLPVKTGVEVRAVRVMTAEDAGFEIETNRGIFHARFVVWAAGEFQYPQLPQIPGASLGLHTGAVKSWMDIVGDDLLIIGGYESGIDAATALCGLGKTVTVLDRQDHSKTTGSDPSQSLSPYTIQRLRAAEQTGRLTLHAKVRVQEITHSDGTYCVKGRRGRATQMWSSAARPLLATGFASSLQSIEALLSRDDKGWLQLSECDESTRTPGLFICGPMVRHNAILMCFIYKFRQRFAVVADAIGERLGLDRTALDAYRRKQMYLDDLSCCLDECAC